MDGVSAPKEEQVDSHKRRRGKARDKRQFM